MKTSGGQDSNRLVNVSAPRPAWMIIAAPRHGTRAYKPGNGVLG